MFFLRLLLALVPVCLIAPSHANAGVVFGVLGIQTSEDAENAATSIIKSRGHTANVLSNLSGTALNGIDVLWVLNADVDQPVELTATYKSAISSFVTNGGVFLYHDRFVEGAQQSLPGGDSISFTRNPTEGANDITVLNSTTQVTTGPGGTINDTTLDNGSGSSHGYATSSSLPSGATAILARSETSQVVDFQYAFGSGFVYYSTIPLDFHLGNPVTNNFKTIYAPNIVAHTAYLAQQSGSSVPEPATMTLLGISLSYVAATALRRRTRRKS